MTELELVADWAQDLARELRREIEGWGDAIIRA
jgi:hypothetical protein